MQYFIPIVLPKPSNDTTRGGRGLGIVCRCTALWPRVKPSICGDPLHSAGDDVRCQLQVKLAPCGNPTAAAVGTPPSVVEARKSSRRGFIAVDLHVVLSESPHCVRVQVDCGGNQVLEPRDESKSDAVRLGPTHNPIDAALARGVHLLGQEGWQLYRLSALHPCSGAIGGAEEVVRDNEPHQLESIQPYDSICKGFFGSCVGKVRQALLIHPGSSWSTTHLERGWKGRIRFVSIILLRSAVSLSAVVMLAYSCPLDIGYIHVHTIAARYTGQGVTYLRLRYTSHPHFQVVGQLLPCLMHMVRSHGWSTGRRL